MRDRLPTRRVLALSIALLCALVTASGSSQPAVTAAGLDPSGGVEKELSLVERIDAIVDAAVASGFAGGVALMKGDDWLYSRTAGFSDAAGRAPVSEATLFHVASITKYFTAVLVLVAAAEHGLALEDPVDPWVQGTGLEGRGLTFEKLLAHRSGLGSSYAAERQREPGAALEAIAAAPWSAADADQFKYSNDGYDLLAILLERLYGRSYEELVRDKLALPAGLENVGFWGETDWTDPERVGQPLSRVPRRLRKRNYGMIGSGGLLITARDLARFQRALGTERILDETWTHKLWAPRGAVSLGQATFGAFLIETPGLGRTHSALGYEEWGDNAILNEYQERGIILAVVTSKGPAEGTGEPFRNTIAAAIEKVLE